jgi:hypothetical protein
VGTFQPTRKGSECGKYECGQNDLSVDNFFLIVLKSVSMSVSVECGVWSVQVEYDSAVSGEPPKHLQCDNLQLFP